MRIGLSSAFGRNNIILLQKLFQGIYNDPVRLVGSGKDAIFVILKTIARISGGGEVILPNYSCPSIPETVVKAGFIPVFVDVDLRMHSSLDSVKLAFGEKTKVALFYHPKGTLVNPSLFKLAKENNVLSIEDSAQHIPGKAGNYGDFSFFSFRTQKPISAGSGGAIIFHNSNYPPSVKLNKYPLTNTIINLIDLKIQRRIYIPRIKSAIDRLVEPVGPYRIGNAESKIVLHALKTLNRDTEKHKEIFKSLLVELLNLRNIKVIDFDINKSKPDSFSFIVKSRNRKHIMSNLRNLGLRVDNWYSHVNSDRFPEYKCLGDENSRLFANSLVNIDIRNIVNSRKSIDFLSIKDAILN